MPVKTRLGAGGVAIAMMVTQSLFSGAGIAQDAKPGIPKQPWSVVCGAASGSEFLICRMTQEVLTRVGRQRLIAVSVNNTASGEIGMRISLPHGVDLTKGVEVSVDNGVAKQLVIGTADAAGAYSGTTVDAELLQSLKKGKALKVAFTAANGQRIETSVSLNGFTAAFAKL